METDWDWCVIDEGPTALWHAITPGAAETRCGLAAPNPDEEWRYAVELGNKRSCDNCTRDLARDVDLVK